MASKAINTIRKVKNTVTGIDVAIPSHTEFPGLLLPTYEYHVVVVTNLAHFKQAKHEETDTIQFMISKKIEDFEILRKNLLANFPNTVLPQLPKRMLIGAKPNAVGRRSCLEKFLQAIVSSGKLATCPVFLDFVGVNPYRLNNTHQDSSRKLVSSQDMEKYDIFEEETRQITEKDEEITEELFGEKQEDNSSSDVDNLFSSISTSSHNPASEDLFMENSSDHLFEKLNIEDTDFIPPVVDRRGKFDDEDDLFKVDGDLDELLDSTEADDEINFTKAMVKNKNKTVSKSKVENPMEKATGAEGIAQGTKPEKFSLQDLEDLNAEKDLFSDIDTKEENLFNTQTKSSQKDVDLFSSDFLGEHEAKGLEADDISSYIRQNTQDEPDELDLFS